MASLTTRYLGLTLKNPIVIGSCSHTIRPETVERLERAGAGAVVLKSIFEEQIRSDAAALYGALQSDARPEAAEYLRADLPMRLGPDTYIERIRAIKEKAGIPVIASVNCVSPEQWLDFSHRIQAAGADAIELNIYDIATDAAADGERIEKRHLALVRAVKSAVAIPLAVKLGPFYSSFAHFAGQLDRAGADGLVLFNRFLQPDVDTETEGLRYTVTLSRPEDILLPLRWVAILREQVGCSLCLTSGVHTADGAAKALLAGADAVQVCSVLYREGFDSVTRIVDGLAAWMDRKGIVSIEALRGRLLRQAPTTGRGLERAQYVKSLVGLE